MAAFIGQYRDDDPANITRGQLAEFELRATMAERERCAKIAESQIAERGLSDNPAYVDYEPSAVMAKKIATIIRAG